MTTRLIRNGEAVNAPVTNRPLSDLQRQIDALRNQISGLVSGRQIILPDVPLKSTTQVGYPVAWDDEGNCYSPALAIADQDSGYLRLDWQARVVGVVRSKSTSTRGDITLYGFDTIDLNSSTGDALPDDGDYYLSPLDAGALTTTPGSLGIRVLRVVGGKILIDINAPDQIEAHTHLTFSLVCKPAGTVVEPAVDADHTISAPNASLPGWLPAGHASFGGLAPDGAIWGYNLNQHLSLKAVWPPLDLNGVSLVWNKGLTDNMMGMEVPKGASYGLAIIDKNGIWWTSDLYQDVPWPYDYDGTALPADDNLSEDPRQITMSLELSFTRLRFSTDTSVVTSLRTLDERIRLLCANDTARPATVGDILLTLDLAQSVLSDLERGATVLKTLNTDGTFTKGRVLEGVYTGSSNVLLSSDLPTINLDPEDVGSPLVYQGMVQLNVVPEALIDLPSLFVRLNGAEDDIVTNVPYTSFPKGRASSIRVGFRVPSSAILTATMKFKVRLLGRVAGTAPSMSTTGRRIPAQSGGTPTNLPGNGTEFAITIATNVTFVSTDQYFDIESTPFAVAAGDTVLIEIGRSAVDAYNGKIGFIGVSGTLVNS